MSLAAAGPLRADLRLTEVLPINSGAAGYLDDDGTAQGWIEVLNTSTTAVQSTGGYRLSNGLTAWSFPDIQIMPDERIVVWASGKNRTTATAPLHTNFTLPAGGGSVYLLNGGTGAADGALISKLQDIPALAADSSWGRDEWNTAVTPTQVGSYSSPTPGARNNYTGAGVAGAVTIGTPSKAFTDPLTVTLTSPSPTAQIRYTIDRSVPVASSPLYTAPLAISTTTMVRARAFESGLLPGITATEGYLLLSSSAASFSSTMPVVVVSNFRTSSPSPDKSDQAAFVWTWEPPADGGALHLTDTPSLASRVSIHLRGSTTLFNAKSNLSVEIRNPYDDDEADAPLVGMPADSDWVVEGPFDFDHSLVHNPFAFALSNTIGRYAPRNQMAEVFMDFSSGSLSYLNNASGDYFGVYNILEKIGRGKARQNLAKLETYDNGSPAKTGGYIWKADRADSSVDQFSAGGVGSFVYDYPKGEKLKSAQRDPQEQYLTQNLNELGTLIHSGNHDPQAGYPSLLDVQSAIDHHLLNLWCFNVDALRLSAFWHKDRNGKVQAGPAWDFDRALSSTDGRDSNPAVWGGNGGTDFFNDTTCVWWYDLFRDPDFYQQYIDRWQELRRNTFSTASVNALLDSLNGQISSDAVTRDLRRWNKTKRPWTSPFTGVKYTGQDAEIQRIKDFLQQRANFIDTQWIGPVTTSLPSGQVATGTTVTFTGPVGATLYYTLDGSDPRPSGGGALGSPIVKTYTAPIAIQGAVHLRIRAYDSSHTALTGAGNPPLVSKWGSLNDVTYSDQPLATAGSVAITEISYQPAAPTAAELALHAGLTGNSFEYLEIRNVSSQNVSLAGAQLTGGVSFTFPAATSPLTPGAFVVVASDPTALTLRHPGVAALGPWTGSLADDGGTVTLGSVQSSVISSVSYDPAWSSLASGGGYSLVVYDQTVASASYGQLANWRTSAQADGSPGAVDASSKTAASPATLVHYWNFNSSATLLLPTQTFGGGSLAIGASQATAYLGDAGQDFQGDNARNGDSPGSHLRVNLPLGSTLTFALPTTGFQNIVVRYETRRSGSGAGLQQVDYTLDGSTYQAFATLPPPDGTPLAETLDFSTTAGAANNPAFGLRITFQQGAAGGTTGNNRFDDFTVAGDALPNVNLPPVPAASLPASHEMVAGASDGVLNLNSFFNEPDGDALTFTATVSPPALASVISLSGSQLTLSGLKQGNATLAVSASDGHHDPVRLTLPLLVHPAPKPLEAGDFLFNAWDAGHPDGDFPEGMVFLQSKADDTALTTPLTAAYTIAAADYAPADVANLGFPYRNSSRTRINGLGANGISMINTGRARDLGGTLVALDTRGVTTARLSWTCGTLTANPRIYAIRLQARTSVSDAFADITSPDGSPLEYVAGVTGAIQNFGPLTLPGNYLGQANLQLLWRYYLVDGSAGGARSQLSLDDIVVTSGSPRNYASWRFSVFPPASRNDDAVSGPAVASNLLRYALGALPGQAIQPFLPTFSAGAGFRFGFDAAKTDIIYQVQRSTDLTTWPVILFNSSTQDWHPYVTGSGLTVPDPARPAGGAYYRLQVQLAQ